MATEGLVGAVRLLLGVDTAEYEDGLNKAQHTLKNWVSGVTQVAGGIQLEKALTSAVNAFVHSIKSAINEADQLYKLSQSIGIPVEELSRLKHVADLSGLSVEELGRSTAKLSKEMASAAAGGTGPAARSFKALGIEVKDAEGNLKSSTQIMSEISDKFRGMEDGAGKTALAMNIFGRAGTSMIPMLNQGGEALRAMMNEADALGKTISTQTAKDAEAFNDNIRRLQAAVEGLVMSALGPLLAALVPITDAFVQSAKEARAFETTGKAMQSTMEGLAEWIGLAALRVKTVAGEFIALGQAISLIKAGQFSEALKVWNDSQEAYSRGAVEMRKKIDESKEGILFLSETAVAEGPKIAPPLVDSAKKVKEAFAEMHDVAKKAMDKLQSDAKSVFEETRTPHEKYLASMQKLRDMDAMRMLDGDTKIRKEAMLRAELDQSIAKQMQGGAVEQQIAQQRSMLASQGQAAYTATRTELEKLTIEQQKLNATYSAGQMDHETYRRSSEKVASETRQYWTSNTESIASSFQNIAQTMGKENKKMLDVAKGFAIVAAGISAYEGAAKALTLPFPANIAAGAAVLAKGLAFVAQIKAQNVPNFAQGGSFRVRGSGGVNSQFVPFMATPGERVDISKPGDERRGGNDTVTLRFEGDDFGIGQKVARKIVTALNEAVRNGARLQVTS